MDRYDPNQWTKTFVKENTMFCLDQLRSANSKVIMYIKQGEFAPAIAGLDRILNGLITMQNAGGDYASELCFFSWVEADVILFGIEAPENKKRETAMQMLEDARDFAKSETTREHISQMLSDLQSIKSIAELKEIYNAKFPSTDIEMLSSLDSKLVAPTPKEVVKKQFCRKCGTEIAGTPKFCPKCGWEIGTPIAPVKQQRPISGIEEAIDLAKNGDERGFSYLYSRTYKYVYARAKCMFSNEQSIKELMQRVYLFAHQNIINFNAKGNIFDWLRTIVFFQGTTMIKKQRKELLFTQEQGAVFSSLLLKNTGDEKETLEQTEMELLCEGLERVTDDQKIALLAYYYDKFQIKAIAELLSVNEGTIIGRVYLGTKRLEEVVKEQGKKLECDIPEITPASLEQALSVLLQKYMDISEEEGKVIFAEICKGLDKGGYQALEKEREMPATSQKAKNSGSNSAVWIIVVVALAVIIAYLLLRDKKGATQEVEAPNGQMGSVMEPSGADVDEEEEESQIQEEEEQQEQEELEEEEEQTQQQEEPSEYILAESNSRYLTEDEVAILTKEELAFARNEIIARHGRIFTNEKYKNYFESKSWYYGYIDPEVFDSNYAGYLNEYEKANIELIRKYEEMQP